MLTFSLLYTIKTSINRLSKICKNIRYIYYNYIIRGAVMIGTF